MSNTAKRLVGLEIFVDESVCVRQGVNCALGGVEIK